MPNNYDSDEKVFLDDDGEVIIITPPDPIEEETSEELILGNNIDIVENINTNTIGDTVVVDESIKPDDMENVQIAKPKQQLDAKRVLHFITSVFLYSILAILGLIFIMFAAYFVDQKIGAAKGESRAPLFGAYVIISESMIPKINVNDAVVTMRVSEKHIHKNDIITFLSKDIETMGTPITHRVVGIVYEDNDSKKVLGYRTKGDNNNTQDFALIKPDEVLGKVYLRLPKVGYIQSFLSKPSGWLLLIVLPCLLIIGNDVYKIVKNYNKE